MNKKLITLLGATMLTLSLAACGGKSSQGAPTGSGSTDTGTSGGETDTGSASEYDENNYSVIVYNPDGTRYANEDIAVLWCTSSNCLTPVMLNANGVAEASWPENDYFVHLENLPDTLTYDPNIYNASATNKHLDIQLYNKNTASLEYKYDNENYEYNRYMLTVDDFYGLSFTSNTQQIFCGYTPKKPGKYKIESYAQVALSQTNADPAIGYYGANNTFLPATPYEEDDNTKDGVNFVYEFEIGMDAFETRDDGDGGWYYATDSKGDYISGWSFTFGIRCTSKTGKTSFPIRITRTGDVEEPEKKEVEYIHASEGLSKAGEPLSGTVFNRGKLLEGDEEAVFNELDGFYHLGDVNGRIIYAKIAKNCEFFDTPLYLLDDASCTNYFRTDEGTKDYSMFIDEYAALCNSDGTYPVNAELKEFFDKVQANQGLFMDGGYISSQLDSYKKGNEWLFCCGYYDAPAGTEDRPFVINEDDIYTIALEANKTVYYKIDMPYYVGAQITCTNANACLIDAEGVEHTSETGFDFIAEFSGGSSYTFGLKFSDGHAGNIGLKVVGLSEIPLEGEDVTE